MVAPSPGGGGVGRVAAGQFSPRVARQLVVYQVSIKQVKDVGLAGFTVSGKRFKVSR